MSEQPNKMDHNERNQQSLGDLIAELDWSQAKLFGKQPIKSMWLKNFKGYQGEHEIPLKPLTLIFGQNNAGKSTVLDAIKLLNASFGDQAEPKQMPADIQFSSKQLKCDLGSFKDCMNSQSSSDKWKFKSANEYVDFYEFDEHEEPDINEIESFDIGFSLCDELINQKLGVHHALQIRIIFSIYHVTPSGSLFDDQSQWSTCSLSRGDGHLTSAFIGKIKIDLVEDEDAGLFDELYEWQSCALAEPSRSKLSSSRHLFQLTNFNFTKLNETTYSADFADLMDSDWIPLKNDPTVDSQNNEWHRLSDQALKALWGEVDSKLIDADEFYCYFPTQKTYTESCENQISGLKLAGFDALHTALNKEIARLEKSTATVDTDLADFLKVMFNANTAEFASGIYDFFQGLDDEVLNEEEGLIRDDSCALPSVLLAQLDLATFEKLKDEFGRLVEDRFRKCIAVEIDQNFFSRVPLLIDAEPFDSEIEYSQRERDTVIHEVWGSNTTYGSKGPLPHEVLDLALGNVRRHLGLLHTYPFDFVSAIRDEIPRVQSKLEHPHRLLMASELGEKIGLWSRLEIVSLNDGRDFTVQAAFDTRGTDSPPIQVPVQSLGTGVRQLLPLLGILGSESSLISIEEPEAHVHPGLQSKLAALIAQTRLSQSTELQEPKLELGKTYLYDHTEYEMIVVDGQSIDLKDSQFIKALNLLLKRNVSAIFIAGGNKQDYRELAKRFLPLPRTGVTFMHVEDLNVGNPAEDPSALKELDYHRWFDGVKGPSTSCVVRTLVGHANALQKPERISFRNRKSVTTYDALQHFDNHDGNVELADELSSADLLKAQKYLRVWPKGHKWEGANIVYTAWYHGPEIPVGNRFCDFMYKSGTQELLANWAAVWEQEFRRTQMTVSDVLRCYHAVQEKTTLMETHSEHVVRTLLGLVATGKVDSSNIEILFVENDEQGSRVHKVGVSERGRFMNRWPRGFFPERLEIDNTFHEDSQ